MYIFIFYSLLASIIVSLFFKFNPEVWEDMKKQFAKEVKEEVVIVEIEEKVKKEKHYSYDERIERGDFYYNQNFLELAANEYNAAILENKTIEAYKKLYKTQKILGEYEKAEKNLLSAYSMQQDNEIALDLVRIKIHKNEFKSAYDLLQKIETTNIEKDYLNFILSILKLNAEETEKKLNELNQKAIVNGNGNIQAKVGVIRGAFDEFNTYNDGKNEHLFLLIAKSLSNGFEFEISTQLAKTIIKKRPNYRDGWLLLGYNQLRMGKKEEALNSIKKAYEIDPTNPDSQFYLAIAYEDLGDKELSQVFYENALKNGYEPKSQIYQKLAEVYYENENYKSAVEMYKNMLSQNSENVDYFLLPFDISANNLQDYELALKIAQWSQRRHPDNPISYSILGYGYYLNGDIEKAKENIQKSIRIDGKLARNYLYAGMISEKMGNTIAAIKQYEMAQKKDPNGKIGLEAIKKYNNIINK